MYILHKNKIKEIVNNRCASFVKNYQLLFYRQVEVDYGVYL